MTEQAAQDPNMPPSDETEVTEQTVAEVEVETEGQAETAPAEVEETGFVETENDKVQKRINKITAEKYAEKRRADEAERKLNEQNVQAPPVQTQSAAEPKLEDYDYDEAAHTSALIDYRVDLKAKEIQQAQQQQAQAQTQQARQQSFNENVAAFTEKATDYEQVVSNLPDLPPQILEAIMQSDKGPELAYHLGKHLDVADSIVTADPMAAAMKLGQITAQLTAITETVAAKTVATSAAPEPIVPINSGGVSNPSMEDMSMEEIYNMK